jgi:hypothetical protein
VGQFHATRWAAVGLELAVLRMLGLFDRPADEKAIVALLQLPAIPGLTEQLTELSQIEWRTLIARLRRARLLAAEDPNNPGQLDVHPLVRQYFGEQLRSQLPNAWKESNTRLYNYYQALVPELPETFRETLWIAVIYQQYLPDRVFTQTSLSVARGMFCRIAAKGCGPSSSRRATAGSGDQVDNRRDLGDVIS